MERVVTLALAAALAFGVTGSLGGNDGAESTASEPMEFEGLIEAFRVIRLGAAVDGLLESVQVDRGDIVAKDQVVATLEARVEKATVALAKARTDMKAEQRSRRARLDYQETKLARDERLHGRGILSDHELAVSRTERAVAQEALEQADERQRIAALEQKRAEANLELRTIRSPIDGVVIERFLSEGELVTRQQQSKIVGLAQIDPLKVEVIVPGEFFGAIERGMKVWVIPTEFSQYESAATVRIVDRIIDAASDTFRVSLELPNPDRAIPPGLRCRVQFLQEARGDG